jgi:lactate dehydrogenase-like 2-hydroxyacid dehydrogenase
MKKVLITRRLIRESEDKASKLFDAKFNTNDELYSQKKIIEMSEGFDGILSSLTEKLDAETINQLPDSVKIKAKTTSSATTSARGDSRGTQ